MIHDMPNETLRNGTPKRVRKPKGEAPKQANPPSSAPADPLMKWARCGVLMSICLSAVLNGYANAHHAAQPWQGWVLGVWVPALVLVFARAAGICYARGWNLLASATGFVVLSLLALSVSHCAKSFSLITGADTVSAALMAVGIDAGLVCCELMTVRKK